MKAVEILNEASRLVGGDRAKTHGDMLKGMAAIARLWNAYLSNAFAKVTPAPGDDYLDATDVANMMELLKVARRQSGAYNPDDYVDGAGYAGVAGECAAIERAGA